MGELVLSTRVAVTRRNLERVQRLSETLEAQDARIDDFVSATAQAADELETLWKTAHELAPELAADEDDLLDDGLGTPVRDVYGELSGLAQSIRSVARELKRQSQHGQRLREDATNLRGRRKDVNDFLLEAARQIGDTLTPGNYLENRHKVTELFSEYVDLLRGIALRQAGLGEEGNELKDLFLIADNLPSLWSSRGWTWQSFAVPSLHEGRPSEASVLRVGFPEWTVWALPLVQHAFAHVYIHKQQISGDAEDEDALADALATIVTGPSYACAALLLRFDPAGVVEPSAEATVRSACVLATLDALAKGTPAAALTTRLRSEWRDAVEVAGGRPEVLDAALIAPATQAVVAAALQETLRPGDAGPVPPVWVSRWGTVASWAEALAGGAADEIDLSDVAGESRDRPVALALLLDAAWLARVGVDPSEDAESQEHDTIASEAVRRMLDVVRPAPKPRSLGRNRPNR